MGDPLSKDPAELRADLRDALNFAIGDEPSEGQTILADVAVESLESYEDSQEALKLVLSSLGTEVFGGVVLHALEFKTSLMGQAESLINPYGLSRLGITLRELGWDDEDLQWPWKDEALIENGFEQSPAVDFDAAQAKAVELGYADPFWKAIVEHYLVDHRYHGPKIAAVRSNLDGIRGDHWEAIIEAFTPKD